MGVIMGRRAEKLAVLNRLGYCTVHVPSPPELPALLLCTVLVHKYSCRLWLMAQPCAREAKFSFTFHCVLPFVYKAELVPRVIRVPKWVKGTSASEYA